MKNVYKGKLKYILASVSLALVVLVTAAARGKLHLYSVSEGFFYNSLTTDTLPAPAKKKIAGYKKKNQPATKDSSSKQNIPSDTLGQQSAGLMPAVTNDTLPPWRRPAKDSLIVTTDTFEIIKTSKDSLDAPVFYHADDSMVMDVPSKKIMLYGKKTTTKYLDNELKAPGIIFDQRNNLVTASFIKDSAGKVIASPTFRQGELLTVSDTMSFNMKTGKGLTKGTYTQQGEMFVYAERMKKTDSTVFYAYKSRITTCNLDTPHFAFVSRKIKFINNKFAVTGPVHPEFEGVPLPIILPFGIYPMYQGRHSGLMAPNFTANEQFGLALENIGYYKVINDHWDITARATLYSYGGWTAQLSPRYYKRYRYQGNFNFNYQHTKINFQGDPDFSVNNTFRLNWTHSMDAKARPGVNFSANVDITSSKFNQFVPNNPMRNFNNQLGSSISYSKVWKDKPFNINVLASHNQNTEQSFTSITLPSLAFNLNTINPFRRKEAVGTLKWYENIGVALNTNILNQTSFYDNTSDSDAVDRRPVFTQIANNMVWGARHNIPVTLSLPPLGALQVSPGVSYTETWYQKRTEISWNEDQKKKDTVIKKGFYTAREMSFSLSVATRIFGMFGFGKNSRIKAIRHEIRPQLSINYKPDMNRRFFYNTVIDSNNNVARLNYLTGNVNAPYGEGRFGGLNFGIDNILQMKVKDKTDTSGEKDKKVSLIDGLGITGGYNFLLDSFQLSTLSINARSNLFEKINITFGGTLDPYRYDTNGTRINRLVWKDKILTLGRLTSGNISISSNFQGGDPAKTKQKKQSLNRAVNPYTNMPLTDEQAEAAFISNNPADYADFSIPWSLQFSYSLRFNQIFERAAKKFKTSFFSDINLNGTINLTPKWQLGFSGTYNFTTRELGMVSLSVAREMHCWQMSINIAPVGRFRFFNIVISPKSALLRDIRINRTRNFFDL